MSTEIKVGQGEQAAFAKALDATLGVGGFDDSIATGLVSDGSLTKQELKGVLKTPGATAAVWGALWRRTGGDGTAHADDMAKVTALGSELNAAMAKIRSGTFISVKNNGRYNKDAGTYRGGKVVAYVAINPSKIDAAIKILTGEDAAKFGKLSRKIISPSFAGGAFTYFFRDKIGDIGVTFGYRLKSTVQRAIIELLSHGRLMGHNRQKLLVVKRQLPILKTMVVGL